MCEQCDGEAELMRAYKKCLLGEMSAEYFVILKRQIAAKYVLDVADAWDQVVYMRYMQKLHTKGYTDAHTSYTNTKTTDDAAG